MCDALASSNSLTPKKNSVIKTKIPSGKVSPFHFCRNSILNKKEVPSSSSRPIYSSLIFSDFSLFTFSHDELFMSSLNKDKKDFTRTLFKTTDEKKIEEPQKNVEEQQKIEDEQNSVESKVNKLDIETKIKALQELEEKNIFEVSKKYKINPSNLRRWKKIGLPGMRKRHDQLMKKAAEKETIEKKLIDWYNEHKGKEEIMVKTLVEVAKTICSQNEVAITYNWVYKFAKKHNLKLEKVTSKLKK